jgi:acetoin utilization protein AcuB
VPLDRGQCGEVRDWMTRKPATISPNCSMGAAMSRMRRSRIRHLLVLDAGQLVGVVSHRDWSRIPTGAAASGWERQPVTRIMSEDPVTVAPEMLVADAARVLLEGRIGCLPVRDGESICGILTISDALEALLSAMR